MEDCRKYFILLILLLYSFSVFAQNTTDSLNSKNFNQLFDLFQDSSDREIQKKVSERIIQNAKQNKKNEELVVGYSLSLELYNDGNKLAYCDSIISITAQKSMMLYPSICPHRFVRSNVYCS